MEMVLFEIKLENVVVFRGTEAKFWQLNDILPYFLHFSLIIYLYYLVVWSEAGDLAFKVTFCKSLKLVLFSTLDGAFLLLSSRSL